MELQPKLKCVHDKEHFVTDQGFINLTIGAPGPRTLSEARQIYREAARQRLTSDNDEFDTVMFQYGTEQGPTSFIQQLSSLLSAGYNDSIDTKSLLLTNGASAGFFLATAILLPKDKSTVIFVESPTYFLVLKMIQDHGFQNIIPIPMQDDGVDTEFLHDSIKKEYDRLDIVNKSDTEKFWAMFYTIPTYHNPTGVCLSAAKCHKVIHLARKFNLLIICDDVYNLLHYKTEDLTLDSAPKRLISYDNKYDDNYNGGHVISNGSFSKILAPGVRIGWIESSEKIVKRLANCGMIYSGGSVNAVTSGIIAAAIELGLQSKHIEKLKIEYGKRMLSSIKVLNEKLPNGFKCNQPGGGYFLWITGPSEKFDSGKFAEFCLSKYKVKVLPGSCCSSVSKNEIKNTKNKDMFCTNAFRISIAYYEHEELYQAILKICEACQEFVQD